MRWAIGIAVTIVLGVAGIALTAFRAVTAKIDKATDTMRDLVTNGDDTLHERVNRVREDVSNNYVRRVDLDSHMKRLDDTLKEVRDYQMQIIRQIAALEARQQRHGNQA